MTNAVVLLVDDEPQLVRALRPALLAVGYDVVVADTGHLAMATLAAEDVDVILLDLGLPDIDGKTVIERIREWSDVPIVVLSARDNEHEKIDALDLGADDFVSKPFGIGELLARLRAVLRGRLRRSASNAQFTSGELSIDFAMRRVLLYGDEVRLTPREYALLRVLALNAGRVVTRKQIIAAVWNGSDKIDPQFIRVLVSQLRSKVEEDSSAPRLIV
ncbi:MAG: response regulator transcription factor, partial [Hyphomonadaceae bacterium]